MSYAIRRIDDLGRVVIPKDLRNELGVREGDQFIIDTVKDPVTGRKGYSIIPYNTEERVHLNVNTEEKAFLLNLSRELNEQPTDGNRDPRWWGILDKHIVSGIDPEYAQYLVCYDSENAEKVAGRTRDELIDSLVKDYDYKKSDFKTCVDLADVVETANEIAAKKKGISSYAPFTLCGCNEEFELVRGPMFLTKKACEEHIKRYGYNYNEPRPYVMTADRCPEYEMLLKILKSFRFDN